MADRAIAFFVGRRVANNVLAAHLLAEGIFTLLVLKTTSGSKIILDNTG